MDEYSRRGSQDRLEVKAFILLISLLIVDVTYGHTLEEDTHRTKRDVGCADKYQTIVTGHTACLPPSSRLIASGVVSNADISTILSAHNQARREVTPTAKNMPILTWDDEIARTAQRWADNCLFKHDNSYKRYAFGRFSVGQNLYMITLKKSTWTKAIEGWVEERNLFTYGGPNDITEVGHYTQAVWDKTFKVGCGFSECRGSAQGIFYLYACNYGPAGNLDYNNPYEVGSTCSGCSGRCNNKLCDCGNKVCYNGGELDLNTCQCTCLSETPLYVLPNCGINCTTDQDPSWCKSYSLLGCEKFSNIPYTCPNRCGWCPAAAYDYKTTSSSSRISSYHATMMVLLVLFFYRR